MIHTVKRNTVQQWACDFCGAKAPAGDSDSGEVNLAAKAAGFVFIAMPKDFVANYDRLTACSTCGVMTLADLARVRPCS
jgi:hypothetical protein